MSLYISHFKFYPPIYSLGLQLSFSRPMLKFFTELIPYIGF